MILGNSVHYTHQHPEGEGLGEEGKGGGKEGGGQEGGEEGGGQGILNGLW